MKKQAVAVPNIDFVEQSTPVRKPRLPSYEEWLATPTLTPWTVELVNLFSHYRARSMNERGVRQ